MVGRNMIPVQELSCLQFIRPLPYAQASPGDHKGYEYSRTANPTRTALESGLASIENGNYGLAFASGLAAIDAIMKLLEPGDEVISTNDLYGGTFRLFSTIL